VSHDKFEAMFTENADLVRRYIARRHVGDDVDDLAAEVFSIAWQRYTAIPAGAELPWLYRTAWNVLANAHRKVVPIATDVLPEGHEPDIADLVVADDRLRWCWEQLEARDREVLRLAAWEGLSGSEMASVLQLSEGGASSALARARARLREFWESSVSD
jgi:RNA polymerase sigma-70 factor (ECF subfamily)